jgi:hypothetical protein
MNEVLILSGCILLFLIPTWFFVYRKKKPEKTKSKRKYSYIYGIKNNSFPHEVYKIGKSTQSPRKLVSRYQTAHPEQYYFVILWHVGPTKLNWAESVLKVTFASRRKFPKSTKKEMFLFSSSEELYESCKQTLNNNGIDFYDLILNKEYDIYGYDLIKGNNY